MGFGPFTDRAASILRGLSLMCGISNEQGTAVPVWLATAEQLSRPEMRGL